MKYIIMKRITWIIIMSLLSFVVFSQKTSINHIHNHFSFKSIPIDGDYKLFADKLISQGFIKCNNKEINNQLEKNSIALSGYYTGSKCLVIINGSAKTRITYCVSVIFNNIESFEKLKNNYIFFKEQLEKKYGKVDLELDENGKETEVDIETNFKFLIDLANKFENSWTKVNGMINLEASRGLIIIRYKDLRNCKKAGIEETDDL